MVVLVLRIANSHEIRNFDTALGFSLRLILCPIELAGRCRQVGNHTRDKSLACRLRHQASARWQTARTLAQGSCPRRCLITSDFQGVPRSMSERVFVRLENEHQLKRHQVMFTFSHNHCGPRLGDDLIDYYPVEAEQEKLVSEYTDQMVDVTVATVARALIDLSPAQLSQGLGQSTFAVNRRNNKEADVPQILAEGKPLAGPVDHDVPVLTVKRNDGQLVAVVFGYACHPTTLSFTTWCGDYPGFAQIEIERAHPSAQAMFVNTCGGDQNPLPRRSVELCQKYGGMLANAVNSTIASGKLESVSSRLDTRFEIVQLPYLQVMDRAALEQFASEGNAIRARWAVRMLKRLDKGDQFEGEYPYPIHFWRLGTQMRMIGMGAETVVDYALRFKKTFGPGTWVCGYSDDMISYIPSRRVWEEGGYEGGSNLYEYGRPALRWSGDIEELIIGTVDKLSK